MHFRNKIVAWTMIALFAVNIVPDNYFLFLHNHEHTHHEHDSNKGGIKFENEHKHCAQKSLFDSKYLSQLFFQTCFFSKPINEGLVLVELYFHGGFKDYYLRGPPYSFS